MIRGALYSCAGRAGLRAALQARDPNASKSGREELISGARPSSCGHSYRRAWWQMGKYGNQRSWGHKDTAKDGGSKSESVRGAQNNNKTERPRGAEAKGGGIDVTRAAEEVSRSMGVQGMARGQASPKGSQRTPRRSSRKVRP